MAANSTSRAEAKVHIAQIRHDKGLSENGPPGHNVFDLENALTTLSEQLYQSSTHFLLELIQNADDNSYDAKVQPSVHFEYSDKFLRVDCNEVGFSPRNVEALCRVGQSTKKGGDNTTRYVGEKGIGFKSVFKAADVVWISSGNYSFKFDKNQQLGMIAPIWEDFPVPVKPGYTSLYLKLSEGYNRKGLIDELRSLDSRLLIFLRRLQRITVSISEPGRTTWRSNFFRTEIKNDLIRLVENNNACDYIVKRHKVSNMPNESKRQGVTSSEIIIGFPITEDHKPKRESQQAYAFLPIRDYGFEFLIQADFLLIASREDIDESSAWNVALRNALTPAFLNCVKYFNKGKLQYLWPRYLPSSEPLQSFLKPFHIELRKQLASQPILISQSGVPNIPPYLTYVPEKFIYKGVPVITTSWNSHRHLSGRYSDSDFEYLKKLGVMEMGEMSFMAELSSMMQNANKEFRAKPDDWHSHLAGILVRLSEYYFAELGNLALIPLADGSWVSATGNQILFPADRNDLKLPGGLKILVVDSKAAADPARRNLYKFLGVDDLRQEPIIKHVQDLHETSDKNIRLIPVRDLASQIKFLFSHDWKNPTFQRFWFTSEYRQRVQGCQLYQDSSKVHSATRYFRANRKKFPFIHKLYLEDVADVSIWAKWLEEKMEVATIPRLVQATPEKGFTLSEDFEYIIKTFSSSDVLLLLRDNWEEYSCYLQPDQMSQSTRDKLMLKYNSARFNTSAEILRLKIRSMLVTCQDGKKHRLDTTFIPSRDLVVASQEGVPFVDIHDPDDVKWKMLETFGVSIKVDVSFYLRCLDRLQGSNNSVQVAKLFDTIQFRCNYAEEKATVKNFFSSKSVVYIPASKDAPHFWISLARCRWKNPLVKKDLQSLRRFTCLMDIYPSNKRLFCEILGVQDATLQDFIHEAKYFEPGDSLAHVTALFHTLEKLLEKDDTASNRTDFHRLHSFHMFPVSKNWKQEMHQVSGLETSSHGAEWFIADTTPLRAIFAGIVPLLDIKVDDLGAMDQVLGEMGLKDRFLSKVATSVPRTQGTVELNEALTKSFRSRVDYIIRLLPTSKCYRKKRAELIKQLRNLQVYTADEVIQQWCVTYRGKVVKGPSGNGHVALVPEGDILKIYVAAEGGLEQSVMDVVDEVFNFCGMQAENPKHCEVCLHVALSETNEARVSKVFTDKGIPTLEGLKFADLDENDQEDNPEEDRKDEKGSTAAKSSAAQEYPSDEPKKGFSSTQALKVVGAVIGFPVAIVVALGALVARKKLFDGDDNGVKVTKVKAKKIKVKNFNGKSKTQKQKAPKVVKPKKEPTESNGFQKSVSKCWVRIQEMACTDEDVAAAGEMCVHRVLTETLNNNYNAQQHWTSKYRTRANFPRFYFNGNETPSFKFKDVGASFTQLLAKEDFPGAKDWVKSPPTYHIDVKSTRGDIHAQFTITPAQFQRARDFSVMMQQMKGNADSIPTDVYILARISDVKSTPTNEEGDKSNNSKIAFLVDPWEYYHADKLLLKHTGKMIGTIIS